MAQLTEGKHPAEFLLSEYAGTLSREAGTLASGTVKDGGPLMASGANVVAWDGASPAAIIGLAIGNQSSGAKFAYISRVAEVKGAALEYTTPDSEWEADVIAGLALRNIIVRAPFAGLPEPESESET